MVQMLKRFCWLWLVLIGARCASGFALLGPVNEAFQVPVIAYDLGGDIGAPKNIGEEYRWNRPTLYYAFDEQFLTFFGSNGVVAVEQAIAVMNGVTNVSSYTPDMYELPLEAKRVNFRAQALTLYDLKSSALNLLVEHLGLAEPERWIWCIHNRFTLPGGTCPPDQVYDIIKRNFDPVVTPLDQFFPTSYVNGTLYTFSILEFCTGPNPLADAIEFPVDPLAYTFTSVASFFSFFGEFYTELTRDDVAGLRYLLRTNNINLESAGADTITFITNNAPQLLFSSNLTPLVEASLTNGPGALLALYPDLLIANTTSFFTNVVTTNVTAYFTNLPWAPSTAPPTLVFATELVTNILIYFNHQFANVITNTFYTNGFRGILETNIGPCAPPAPSGTVCTNISFRRSNVPMVAGDVFIIPTNLCGISIISTQLVRLVTTTNLVLVATNATGATNIAGQEFSRSIVNFFTNYIVVVNPVVCPQNTVAHRQGIERIRYVRRDFDSLVGQFYHPVTNTYTLVALTNNTFFPQTIQRVVTTPDVLFTADDIAPGPSANVIIPAFARGITYNQANILPNLAGPGTIEPDVAFVFNKVGPIYSVFAPAAFLADAEAGLLTWVIWGSFDGSTNAPVVYPNGTSLQNLENQVFIQVSPANPILPNGQVGLNYAGVFSGFTATGAVTPPATWSLAPFSPGLPPGLTLNANGTITGVPGASASGLTYDFIVRMTDSVARFVDRPYEITIDP